MGRILSTSQQEIWRQREERRSGGIQQASPTTSVKDYQEKFEELSSLMLIRDPHLSESYFVSSFISGIKEEIKPMVKMLKPATLLEAFEIAEWQEQLLALNGRNTRNSRTWEPGESSKSLSATFTTNPGGKA